MMRVCVVAVTAAWVLSAAPARPALAEGVGRDDRSPDKIIWAAPTLGGVQFWADELLFHDWRIQRNTLTGHYRLLDGSNRRHESGSFAECRDRLEQLKHELRLEPMRGNAVILLHGLGRSRASMKSLARFLREDGGFTVLTVGYPSTQAAIEQHAKSLARVIEHLDGVEEIHFVGHSLGNLIVRCYLTDTTDPRTGRQGDPRLGRFVMLGPPNAGAHLATLLLNNRLMSGILGEAPRELADPQLLRRRLAIPDCQFGIIAGGRRDPDGYNPILPGDDDLIVAVEETRLPGAHDFLVLPVVHTFMMDDDQVQKATLRFLQRGHFVSEERRQPIER